MSGLPDPLREVFEGACDEAELQTVWRGVQRRRKKRRAMAPMMFAAAAVGVFCALFVGFVVRGERSARQTLDRPGPLGRVAAAGTEGLAGGSELGRVNELSDGSRIDLRPGSHLAVLENSGRVFATLLGQGHADFEVKPGGPRRWIIECGAFTVEVVGTAFSVDRSPASARVDVRRGVVLVRGDQVPDRVRRLSAGESWATSPTTETHAAPLVVPSAVIEASPSATAPGNVSPPASAAPPAPLEEGEDSVEALYAEADRFRRAGNAAEAAERIERALLRDGSGHRAALSAFTLGRLYLEDLQLPSSAATAFERALARGAPASLEEDVRARLVEARARMGDSAGARKAAATYRERFPSGRRREEVERWAQGE